ncbi:hypothetical protein INR49_007498 [Caranx melampygus]|nr:hypothetical protein INR49_007498 [Caranx melampygus]
MDMKDTRLDALLLEPEAQPEYKPKPIISKTTNHVNQKGSEKPLEQAFAKMLLHGELGWKTLAQQRGVFRSNCMDCLDRTNVIQSLLARRSLQSQLQRMGVLNVGQRIEEQAEFEKIYKNGNSSLFYA